MAPKLIDRVKELSKSSHDAAKQLEVTVSDLEKIHFGGGSSVPKGPMAKLGRGFQTFKVNVYDKDKELFDKLKSGQSPKYMVIACSDSRVDPAIILGLKVGDAFVVRNIANLVPAWEPKCGNPSVASALEYAVKHLHVEHIVVVGHRKCGGIEALVVTEEDKGTHDFIEKWMEIAQPARTVTKAIVGKESVDEQCKFCEKESVNVSLSNLLTYPWIKEKVIGNKLSLHGGYYDFVKGYFQTWDLDINVGHSQKF
ncbi:carbonic anhydrase 2 [Physcomitrium patens]|uniref:Carbonic anhydrase n=1 Tax=Physcomitrium patens TaxID=3218 RepID=A9RV59_PHYPA|nr:carbonic anhydrase 2-like [Physcomitrium patens]XP_024404000.1 carbonic anhydrase 2-like [Physcomitrium patens]XP_024404011.1 carbonic anhydrase 2-like [Physcomitrium patens]PNR59920.1 hypothetical protein PHYPA_002712 [Physcomitrium patens]|eukprot:XP_024403991.1 carbonic anhydrase 2-like [Physcomitrella patens]